MIGNLIFSNKVKEKNVDIMLKFLNKAVDLGSIAALNTLGRYYLNIDDVTALKYFKKPQNMDMLMPIIIWECIMKKIMI